MDGTKVSSRNESIMQTGLGLPRFRVVKDKLTGLYKCHLCSYKSVYGSSLRSHFAVHSNARPYGCDMCSYEAKRLPDLKKHKILKHIRKNHCSSSTMTNKNPLQVFRDPGSGLYRCQHCSYQSDNLRCVRSHLAVHSHLRPYACDTCSYEAKRSSDLSKHKIIKHGRIPCRRNKSRKTPAVKADTTYNTSSGDVGGNQKAQNLMMACSTSKLESHHGQMELDHCDVLSDLDYSLMGPTRVALEALRRCNMMEPLDMFNEYSGHDGFQQNMVFPEAETHAYGKKQYTSDQAPTSEQNQVRHPHYNLLASYQQGQTTSRSGDDMMFIKPEPPDDYFEHIKPQNQVSTDDNSHSQKSNVVESEVSTTNMTSLEHRSGSETTSSQSANHGSRGDGSATASSDPVESSEPDACSLERPRSEQSMEGESRNVDSATPHLERRQISGTSLLRSFISNPCQQPDLDHVSSECTPSLESGCSTPGISAPIVASVSIKSETESSNTKTTNTRKAWNCQHCDIMFFDGALYFMHMGLHNSEDPWKCNMCQTKFYDVYGFTSHFVNGH